jgi:serine/threonine protein kinase
VLLLLRLLLLCDVLLLAAPAGLSAETLLRFKAEVDFQRKLSYHPNVVRFIGACCELPAGLAEAVAEAAAAQQQRQRQQQAAGDDQQQLQRLSSGSSAGGGGGCGVQYIVPPGLARGVKLAIVMELCHLGSLFSMIGQVSQWGCEAPGGGGDVNDLGFAPTRVQPGRDHMSNFNRCF